MAEIVKKSVTTKGSVGGSAIKIETRREASNSQTIEYVIYYILGALEIFLAFRLVLKLMGASITSGFVSFIYALTGVFILPFEGIFRRGVAQGIETVSVFEPSTFVALIVYAVVAWGIVRLVRIFSGEEQEI
jgi:hypothetical protein